MALTTTFVGLDTAAVGNGDSDETQTVDTFVQHRIQLNNEALLAPRNGYGWQPYTDSSSTLTSFGGIRPYCARQEFTCWRGQIYVRRGQTAVRVTLLYHSQVPGHTTDAGTVTVTLRAGDGSKVSADLDSTYDSGTKTGTKTITLTFLRPIQRSDTLQFSIWAISDSTASKATTHGPSSDGTTSNLSVVSMFEMKDTALASAPGYFDPNSTASTLPDDNSFEAMYLDVTASANSGRTSNFIADLFWAKNREDNNGTVAGSLQALPLDTNAAALSATAYLHQCLFLRAVWIEDVFKDFASPAAQFAYMDRARIGSNIEFGSAEAMIHAQQVINAFRQESVALIGPKGRLGDTGFSNSDLNRFAAGGYPVRWPTILGNFDGSSSGEKYDMINDGLYLRTENPKLVIRCTWVSFQHDADWNRNQVGTPPPPPGKNANVSKIEREEEDGPGFSKWTMAATLEHLDYGGNSWSSDVTEYGSVSATVQVDMYGARLQATDIDTPPITRGVDFYLEGKNDTADAGFWFKEGQLFPADLPLISTETEHILTVSGTSQTEILKPFRLQITMTPTDKDGWNYVETGYGVTANGGDVRLLLVSCTVTERPELP
jgi:hypothetical protein